MELDLQSLFGLHVKWCAHCTTVYSLADTPEPPALPPHFGGSYTRALLVSQDRRHLFVTPCLNLSNGRVPPLWKKNIIIFLPVNANHTPFYEQQANQLLSLGNCTPHVISNSYKNQWIQISYRRILISVFTLDHPPRSQTTLFITTKMTERYWLEESSLSFIGHQTHHLQ
jgi:hypothetical protein